MYITLFYSTSNLSFVIFGLINSITITFVSIKYFLSVLYNLISLFHESDRTVSIAWLCIKLSQSEIACSR